jgi:hypothetical protein
VPELLRTNSNYLEFRKPKALMRLDPGQMVSKTDISIDINAMKRTYPAKYAGLGGARR